MHQFISFNNRIYSATTEAHVSAVSAAVLYGRGIFTTVAIEGGGPLLWNKHWTRLQDNARRIGLDISGFPEDRVTTALAHLIEQNSVSSGLARITFFDEGGGGMWPVETGRKTCLLIATREPRPAPQNFKLTISPYRINSASPLAGVKSCNYLENLLAFEEARGRGFDEAVRLNERGQVASACMANVFWSAGGKLYTPTLATGCLPGTVRSFVIEKHGAIEMDAGIEVLDEAEAIILTSSGIGIIQAAEFEGRRFQQDGKISLEFWLREQGL